MESIKNIVINKKINRNSNLKINTLYEEADEFAKYVGLPTTFVLRCMKFFGKEKVLSIRGFLKDFPYDKRGLQGVTWWKLKNISLDKQKEQNPIGY